MNDRVARSVFTALGRQLGLSAEHVAARQHDQLDGLGLDSHGLLRVLLDIERECGLERAIELDDAALESPSTLVAGVIHAAGAQVGR